MSSIDRCRICGHSFFKDPLLTYNNMPKMAQFLPDADSLKSDKGIELTVCQCSGCGLVQLDGDPVPYYKEVIRATAFSEEMKNFRIKQFDNFINNYSLKGKKVIEIGCGRGEYLSIMQTLGVEAFGLEHSEESVKQCIDSDLKVSEAFIDSENQILDHAPFDSFYMLNYLEHLPDPNSTLRGIHGNLTDNACGLVEVPNFDMIIQDKLFSEFTADHLLYFTKETFSTALTLNGFEVIECNEIWHKYIISAIVKKRERLNISGFHAYQAQLKNEITEYVDRFKNKKVAIWGAGHQALAVIALMGLAGKIKYVVDSAPFKQGKYTPASHLPIVSPDALEADPVDAVIIMAAGYSDEVARIIRQRFNDSMSVSILRSFGLEELEE